jgi:hypothetical protein
MKKRSYQWLEFAHQNFPLPIKSLARGAISGSVAGILLSLGYSMFFGLPFSFVVFILFLTEVQSKGIRVIGNGLGAVFFVMSSLVVQYVLPSTAIGITGGAITGLGTRFAHNLIAGSSFRATLLSIFFWTPITFFVSTRVLPKIMLSRVQWSDNFDLWLFIYAPSIIFVFAMAYVAKKSLNPFIRTAENG